MAVLLEEIEREASGYGAIYNDTHHLIVGIMRSRQIRTRTFFWVHARYTI